MTADLVAFLHARLDEDERLARAVEKSVGTHRAGAMYDDDSGTATNDAFPSYPWGAEAPELPFMAGPGHPARVLADVQAKRAILALHHVEEHWAIWSDEPDDGVGSEREGCMVCTLGPSCPHPPAQEDVVYPCRTVLLLASAYTDHPDFRDEWRVDVSTPDLGEHPV